MSENTNETESPVMSSRRQQEASRRNGEAKRGVAARESSPGDRLPPHSDEAEAGVLGCILWAPVECMEDCGELGVTEDWFYDLSNRTLWHGFTRLHATETPIDEITILQWLSDQKKLADIGGAAKLGALRDSTPSAANLAYYLDIVREKFVLRQAVARCTVAIAQAYEAGTTPAGIVAEARAALEELAEQASDRKECALKSVLPAVIDGIEEGYHRGSAQVKGLTTGFGYLDKILCGIGGENGNFLVLAARPGVGKSAIAMQIAEHVALAHKSFTPQKDAEGKVPLNEAGKPAAWEEHRGLPVGVFSLEMDAEELVKRMLFQRSGVDAQRFKTGFASKEDFDRLSKASLELNDAKIFIDDSDSLTVEELQARARVMVRKHGIKLFILDYIQLLQVTQKRFRQDRVQEMAEISNGLRRVGKTLGVPFIVLAQMNRDFAKEAGVRKPRLTDLRDCGAIEQDAHVVMFLYEEQLNAKAQDEFDADIAAVLKDRAEDDWSVRPRLIQLLVAKNRHGMNNKGARLLFDGSCTRFHDYYEWRKGNGLQLPAKGERSKPVRRTEEEDLL
jgi:replicative DNA helicase